MENFLKRRLNPFLLISTVVVLAILAGLSVTYQDVLSDKVSTNQELRQDLDEKQVKIAQLENQTSNLSSSLERTRQDLSATVNETLRMEETIEGLEDTVSDLNSTVIDLRGTVETKEDRISNLSAELEEKNDTLNLLEGDLEFICLESDNNLTSDSEERCEDWGY